jgi:hypothetical protein
MQSNSPGSMGHQVTLHALEVLRLIADRMERKHAVDIEDIHFLLRCFSEVSHPSLGSAAPDHQQLHTLYAELAGKLDSQSEEFVRLSRVYTNRLADLILLEGVQGRESIVDFSRQTGHPLHHLEELELKYVTPHCI